MPPKPRLQTGSPVNPVPLATPAAPVDTFAKPTAGQQLEQLAQGLAKLEPSLGNLSQIITERDNQQKLEAGLAKASELNRNSVEWRRAIQQGLVTADQSPWFQAGLREGLGKVSADRMNFELISAANADEGLRNSIDPKDYQRFVSGFIQQWYHDNIDSADSSLAHDPRFSKGFASKADAYIADGQRTFAAQVANRSRTAMNDVHFQDIKSGILSESQRGTPWDNIAQSIAMTQDDRVLLGANPGQIRQASVNAIGSAAIDLALAGSPDALKAVELLKQVRSGPAGTPALADFNADASAYYESTKLKVAGLLQDTQTRNIQTDAQARRQQADAIQTQIVQTLVQNPNADIHQQIAQLAAVDPDAALTYTSAPERVQSISDQTAKLRVFADIWNNPDTTGVTTRTIVSLMNAGKISIRDADYLNDQLRTARNSGTEAVLNEDSVRYGNQVLQNYYQSNVSRYEPFSFNTAFSTQSANVRSQYVAWRQSPEGQTADYSARLKKVNELVAAAIQSIEGATPAGGSQEPQGHSAGGDNQKPTSSRSDSTTTSRAQMGMTFNPGQALGYSPTQVPMIQGKPASVANGPATGISYAEAASVAFGYRVGFFKPEVAAILQKFHVAPDPASVQAFVRDASTRWNIPVLDHSSF